MKKLFFILFLFLTISCSTTRYVEVEREVPVVEVKTKYEDKLVYDSIYMRDSVFVFTKGDTVYVYKEKNNTRYVYKTDTLVKVDSIPYPVKIKETEIKEVYRIKWWQSIFLFTLALIVYEVMHRLKTKLKL